MIRKKKKTPKKNSPVGCFSAEGWDVPNECTGYDTKQSDGEAPVMVELYGTWSIRLLLSLPDPVVVAPHRVLSMG